MKIKRFNEAKKVDKKLEVNITFEFDEKEIEWIKDSIDRNIDEDDLEDKILIQYDDFIKEYIEYSIAEKISDGLIVNHTSVNNEILDYIYNSTDETVKEVKSI